MKKIIDYLQKLEFSEVEIKIYLMLLKSGAMTVASLAEKAKINRTATYSHINSLLEKGVIAKVKGKANKIAANPPEQLHILVEQKAIQVGMLQEKLPSVISLLYSSFSNTKTENQSEIKYYKGRSGVKSIYRDILNSNRVHAYFSPGELYDVFPENVKLFHEALNNNPKMEISEIVEDTTQARSYIEYSHKNEERHFWRLLPKETKLIANDILIYEGKVAIINIRDKDNVTGVVLNNQDFYNNSVQLFDLLWRLLPEPAI